MAKRDADKLREDVMWVASKMQNHPAAFTRATNDRATWKELSRLVSHLLNLTEIIVDEEAEDDMRRAREEGA